MKYAIILLFISNFIKAQTPLTTNTLRASINQKLTSIGDRQITAPQLKEIINSLIDQIEFKANSTDLSSVLTNTNTRTAFQSIASLRNSKISKTLAPGALIITDTNQSGTFVLDSTDTTTPDNTGTVLRTASNLCYKRVIDGWGINVKWFGAKGDGLADDKEAIQLAVDWAKVQRTRNGGNVRINIIFPNGTYRLNGNGGINLTNANGIWLSGGDGKYLTTQINGNCGNAIFDFTGSTMSGCSGFTFLSLATEKNPSAIGVLYALSQNTNGKSIGGLNCSIKDCYFQLDNNPKLNGGYGTVGVVNIRSEEFKIDGCLIRANTGVILSNQNNIKTKSASNLFKSTYANIATGSGSMGVVDIIGTSIQNYEKLQHALILNGTNGINFSGYLYGNNGKIGSEDAAVGLYQSNLTLNLSGTIEGFSTILYFSQGAKLYNSQIKYSYANINDIAKPVIYMEANSLISHCDIGIVFGNGTAEMGNRYFLYTPPVNNGDEPTTALIVQSNFRLPDWHSNIKVISASLLKQTTGICRFITGQPFTTDSQWVRDNKKYSKSLGRLGGTNTNTLLRFLSADKTTTTNNNGGLYIIKINGTVRIGNYSSKGSCVANFESTISITQDANGTRTVSPANTTIISKSQTSQTYADISNITTYVVFEAGIGSIKIVANTTGLGKGEPVTFLGNVSVFTDFLVNGTPIFD